MSETIDLNNLDIDLTGVDLSRPLLPKQTLRCRIGEVQAIKDEKRGRQLVVPLQLEEPGVDTNGHPINIGFGVTDRINLDPKGKWTAEAIRESCGRLQAAALKLPSKRLEGPVRASEWTGKEVLVTFDVRMDKQDSSKQYQDMRYSAVPN